MLLPLGVWGQTALSCEEVKERFDLDCKGLTRETLRAQLGEPTDKHCGTLRVPLNRTNKRRGSENVATRKLRACHYDYHLSETESVRFEFRKVKGEGYTLRTVTLFQIDE